MAQKLLIGEIGGSSMVGSWHHELFLTLCSDGTCSLRLRLQGDSNSYWPRGIRNIRTAGQLMSAIDEMREMSQVVDAIDFDELVNLLMPYSPGLAKDLFQTLLQESEPDAFSP
jgi:hypothetical protein